MFASKAVSSLALLIAVASLLPGCSKPEDGKLLFRPPVGSTRIIDESYAANIMISFSEMEMAISLSESSTLKLTVESVAEDGAVTLKAAYDSVEFDISGPGMAAITAIQNLSAPGVIPEDPFGIKDLQNVLDGFVGKPFTVRVSSLGKVLSVEGIEEIAREAVGAQPATIDPDIKEQREKFAKSFSDDESKESFEDFFLLPPATSIGVGDTWTGTIDDNVMDLPFSMKVTHTLKDRTNGYANVSCVLEIEFDLSDGLLDLVINSGKANGKGSGTLTFEEATGWMTRRIETTKSNTAITILPPAGVELTPDMPRELKGNMEIKFKTEVVNTAG